MKIAMIGQKGVPATFGGVERHVEELAARLVDLGHEVTVYTRPNYTDPCLREYRGIRLKSLPTIGTKHLDAIIHSLLASFACWRGSYDVVHYHAIGPCLASPIARLRGLRLVATIHGQDWRRGKWGRLASTMLRIGEWMALRVPHVTISVSDSLAQMYRNQGHTNVRFIPNGIRIEEEDDLRVLAQLGLSDGAYVLSVGRLVPEKGLHYLVKAHSDSDLGMPLVIAGDSSNTDTYVDALKADADETTIFTGYEYGVRLATLFRHAALFVLPSDLEGLPIVLLEALAYGVPVLASDIAPNVEVLGDKGEYFRAGDVEDLHRALVDSVDHLEEMRADVASAERVHAMSKYDWDTVAAQTLEAYQEVS